ncbi:hypothetical protein GCM10009733_014320 [Nonomuraea maheshkhaliensis]|uniref:Uncharacterized protein n=1 Tax=Nonomuraea maheshkhaliensis TaxID=419590 RepID=A0ABP4QVB4_9ACTN
MSWTLRTPDGRSLRANAWNWRPTLELLERGRVLDEETLMALGCNGRVELSGAEARQIAVFLDGYLPGVPGEGRVLLDGTVTTEPDTFEFHREELDRNYSATAEWLTDFRDFCRDAPQGFTCS